MQIINFVLMFTCIMFFSFQFVSSTDTTSPTGEYYSSSSSYNQTNYGQPSSSSGYDTTSSYQTSSYQYSTNAGESDTPMGSSSQGYSSSMGNYDYSAGPTSLSFHSRRISSPPNWSAEPGGEPQIRRGCRPHWPKFVADCPTPLFGRLRSWPGYTRSQMPCPGAPRLCPGGYAERDHR